MKLLTPMGRKQRVETVRFSPNAELLLSAGNGSWLDVWSLDTATAVSRHFETTSSYAWVINAAFVANGTAVIATCGVDGLKCHAIVPESPLRTASRVAQGSLWGLAITPDEHRIVTSTGCLFVDSPGKRGYEGWLRSENGEYRSDWFVERRGIGPPTFTPDGEHFVATETTEIDGRSVVTVVRREANTGQRLDGYPYPDTTRAGLLFSPTGELLVARSQMRLLIWTSGELSAAPKKLLNSNRKHFTDFAFHPSGSYLAATSNDATVKLYDTTTWEVARTFTWDIGRMRSVAFSPDGTLAAAGSDTGKVVVWDVDV